MLTHYLRLAATTVVVGSRHGEEANILVFGCKGVGFAEGNGKISSGDGVSIDGYESKKDRASIV